jgi:Tol biopolymer transport system component
MRSREILFGSIAATLLVIYLILGLRVAPLLTPAGTPTPTPPKPSSAVAAPRVPGTIAFMLRGDVYVLSAGKYVNVTTNGTNESPALSPDGRTLLFARTESLDGKRIVDGQVTPAILRYADIVAKPAAGGAETILVTGLQQKLASGFDRVVWQDDPAVSPDGARFAIVVAPDDGSDASDLTVYDMKSTAEAPKRVSLLSQGSNLEDVAWSPDGKTIVVTSYTLGVPRVLLIPTDGRAATPQKIDAEGEPYRASYSPDGKWLVYTLRHPGSGGNDVHAVEIATGHDVALTTDGKSWNGVFSPDGAWVAFLRESGGVIDLYAMEVATALTGGSPKAAIKLTNGEGIDGESRPAWAR